MLDSDKSMAHLRDQEKGASWDARALSTKIEYLDVYLVEGASEGCSLGTKDVGFEVGEPRTDASEV